MKFSDLRFMGKEEENIPIEILLAHDVPGPREILSQVYSDHGTKQEFQDQFGNIGLNDIVWNKIQVPAEKIMNCSIHENFLNWFNCVSKRSDDFETDGWDCIDVRKEVVESWREKATWLISPIFINGTFIGKKDKYHLVEGHTRVGLLTGLIKNGILSQKNMHSIWYGDIAEEAHEKYNK